MLDTLTGLTEAVGSGFNRIDRRFGNVDEELHAGIGIEALERKVGLAQ